MANHISHYKVYELCVSKFMIVERIAQKAPKSNNMNMQYPRLIKCISKKWN